MQLFKYYVPTKVVFGKGAETETGALVQSYGARKVLIHYGGGSVIRSGLLSRVIESLEEKGIDHVQLGGVVPNPRLDLVYEGIQVARENDVDFILAVGGGSVIDSAKAIAYGASNPGDVWDFFCGKRKPTACMPIGAVLTIAATGSEMSYSTVITNPENALKRAYNDDIARPVFAVLNPELTMTLPAYQTSSGCADILMHTMERYLNGCDTNMEITDSIAEGLMRTVIKYALKLVEQPNDYEARAEIMWAGSLSHNGLTGFGTDNGDWITHKLEHELSGAYNVAHGAGLAALWGSWARYVLSSKPSRFAKFAVNVMNIEKADSEVETGLRGIEAVEEFFRNIHMPTSLKELGVEPSYDQIKELAKKCADAVGGCGGSVKKLREADFEAIYQAAIG